MLDAYRTPDRLLARIQLHERFGNASFDIHQWMFDLLLGANGPALVPETARVLEVGAGTGRMWQVACTRVPPGWSLTLTDRSEGMVADLTCNVGQLRLNASVKRADATALPFADSTFDLAFANHMLYHVPRPSEAIRELRRVLKPGGVLVAATNSEGHMRQVVELAGPLSQLPGIDLTGIGKLSFTCESGGALLAAEFAQVRLHEHDDQLNVTDARALLAYMQSLVHLSENAPQDTLDALQAWERQVLAVPLPYQVERRTGVFVARVA